MTSLELHAGLVARRTVPSYKRCSRCAVLKPLSAYYRNPRNRTDGRRGDCKQCFKVSRVARWAGLGEVPGLPGDDVT